MEEKFRRLGKSDRGSHTSEMLLGAADDYAAMAEAANAIERTYQGFHDHRARTPASGDPANSFPLIGTNAASSSVGHDVLPDSASDDVDHIDWLAVASALRHTSFGLLASLIALTLVAWGLSIYQVISSSAPMAVSNGMDSMAMMGMPAVGWSISGAAMFVIVWTVMMAAMMLPEQSPRS
jgi:hypothetical protein